jgi:deoxycytidylate deaminase
MSGIKRIVYFDEYSKGVDNDIANEILKNTQVDILITEELKQFAQDLNIIKKVK